MTVSKRVTAMGSLSRRPSRHKRPRQGANLATAALKKKRTETLSQKELKISEGVVDEATNSEGGARVHDKDDAMTEDDLDEEEHDFLGSYDDVGEDESDDSELEDLVVEAEMYYDEELESVVDAPGRHKRYKSHDPAERTIRWRRKVARNKATLNGATMLDYFSLAGSGDVTDDVPLVSTTVRADYDVLFKRKCSEAIKELDEMKKRFDRAHNIRGGSEERRDDAGKNGTKLLVVREYLRRRMRDIGATEAATDTAFIFFPEKLERFGGDREAAKRARPYISRKICQWGYSFCHQGY